MQSQLSITDGSFFVTSWPHKSISLRFEETRSLVCKIQQRNAKSRRKNKTKNINSALQTINIDRQNNRFRRECFLTLTMPRNIRSHQRCWCELCSLSGCEIKQFHLHPIMRPTSRYDLDQIWLWVSVRPASKTLASFCSLAYGLNVVVIVVTVIWGLGLGGRETYYSVWRDGGRTASKDKDEKEKEKKKRKKKKRRRRKRRRMKKEKKKKRKKKNCWSNEQRKRG